MTSVERAKVLEILDFLRSPAAHVAARGNTSARFISFAAPGKTKRWGLACPQRDVRRVRCDDLNEICRLELDLADRRHCERNGAASGRPRHGCPDPTAVERSHGAARSCDATPGTRHSGLAVGSGHPKLHRTGRLRLGFQRPAWRAGLRPARRKTIVCASRAGGQLHGISAMSATGLPRFGVRPGMPFGIRAMGLLVIVLLAALVLLAAEHRFAVELLQRASEFPFE